MSLHKSLKIIIGTVFFQVRWKSLFNPPRFHLSDNSNPLHDFQLLMAHSTIKSDNLNLIMHGAASEK